MVAGARGLLGVLAFVHDDAARPFGEQTGYIRGLLTVARQLGVRACAFGPEDVDVARRRIRGYRLGPNGWRRVRCGWPDLVYDRFFLHEPRAEVLRRYRSLRRSGTLRFLNPTLPDKWAVYRQLRGHQAVCDLLPPTWRYRHANQLLESLRAWRRICVKPAGGMKGRGLWFLRVEKGDRLVVASATGRERVLSLQAFRSWAARHLGRRHVVQPTLALRDRRGRPFDIRVLVQRDGQGHLVVTGVGVRVGRAGSHVANLHRGGQAMSLPLAIERLDGLRECLRRAVDAGLDDDPRALGERVLDRVRWSALAVTHALEGAYGVFAELGLDFGLDLRRGRLYFLEANSRPGRRIFQLMGDPAARAAAVRRPIEYARWRLSRG